MPIEFFCPGCGNLMRTPDETAGRKGRCPTCQLKVQIPSSTVASTTTEPAPRTAQTPKAPLRFDCGRCGKTLSIATTNAGKKGKCPHCGELMSIPTASAPASRWKGVPKTQPASSATRSSASRPQPPMATKSGVEKIEFACTSCREVVRVGVAAAGKKGRCPRCQTVIQIPLRSTSQSALQPLPATRPESGSPTPQRKPNAATPASTPLPDNSPPSSALTPLDADHLSPLEPLSMIPASSMNDGVTGDDLFGSSLSGSTPSDEGNPFARDSTPRSAPRSSPVERGRPTSKRKRTGAEIATMCCGGCLAVYSAAHIILVLVFLLFRGGSLATATTDQQLEAVANGAFAGVIVACQIIAAVLSGIVMAGGVQMIRLKSWGLCLAACILTIMPCNGFCLLGSPLGIWGAVMLSLGSVRAKFSHSN